MSAIVGPSEAAKSLSLQTVLGRLIAFKVLYAAIVLAIVYWAPNYNQQAFQSINETWFDGKVSDYERSSLARHFVTWDTAHYLFLAENGYSKEQRSCAFYPLWPAMIRAVGYLTGGNQLITGLILANVLSIAALAVFYKTAAERFGPAPASWATISMVAFPGAIFLQFVYSESLFLLLLMLLWRGLERDRKWLVFASGFLLPLTRAIGLFCVLPIAWRYLGGRIFSSKEPGGKPKSQWLADCLPTAMPLAGFGFYLLLMAAFTGDAFTGMKAQSYWGAHSVLNLVNAPKFVAGFFEASSWHSFRGSLLDRYAFAVLLVFIPAIWRLGKDMLVWTYVLAILPAMSGTFVSFTRFEALAFPFFLALGARLLRTPIGLRNAIITMMLLLQIILLWRHLNFYWAG